MNLLHRQVNGRLEPSFPKLNSLKVIMQKNFLAIRTEKAWIAQKHTRVVLHYNKRHPQEDVVDPYQSITRPADCEDINTLWLWKIWSELWINKPNNALWQWHEICQVPKTLAVIPQLNCLHSSNSTQHPHSNRPTFINTLKSQSHH